MRILLEFGILRIDDYGMHINKDDCLNRRPRTNVYLDTAAYLAGIHYAAMQIDLKQTFGLPTDAGIGPVQALWCTPEMRADLWRTHHLHEAEKYAAAIIRRPEWTHASVATIARFCDDRSTATIYNWFRRRAPGRRDFKRIARQMIQEILEEHGYDFAEFCAFLERR